MGLHSLRGSSSVLTNPHGSRIGTENLGAFPRTIIGDFTPKPDGSISEIPEELESFTLEQHSLATAAFRLELCFPSQRCPVILKAQASV